MSIYEYDEELHIKTMMEIGREEGYETGRREGLETGRQEGLETGKIIAYHDAGLSISDISARMNLTSAQIENVLQSNPSE